MWSTLSPAPGSAVPCSRSKLAVCVHDGHVYMLGGRNGNIPIRDFWKFSLTEHVWTEIRSTGDVPSNLQDHTIVGWKGRLYVFGGEVGFASTGETPLWVYDIATNHWRKLTRSNAGSKPHGCRGHTVALFQNCMYIYGGYRDLKGSTNELWCFDLEKESWRLSTYKGSSEIPSGRHDHSVVVHDSAMYVYGGMTDLQAKADFWKYDFVSRQWSRVRCKGGPGELHGHTACKVLTSMVIFGGERSGQLQNEIWRFHFATDTWEKLVFSGAQPSPRSRHFAVVVPTLLLLLPQLYDGGQATPQHKQRQFQELVTSGSYAPNYPPNDSWELEPPPPPRIPKSETISNCREMVTIHEDGPTSRKITSSFSQNNFKYLKERISTSSLFKPQNATYVALSNSSESVQEDAEAALLNDAMRTTQSSYALDANRGAANKNMGNNRFCARPMLSVPNFQRIQNQELRGLMEDLSDSSSVDVSNRVDNQAYCATPKKGVENGVPRNLALRGGCGAVKEQELDNGHFYRSILPGSVTMQDSLESIPDIKDFISPDLSTNKNFPEEDCRSLKLIDLEADCDSKGNILVTSPCFAGTPPSVGIPKSLSCQLDNGLRPTLPVVKEHAAWDSHKDYASCLNMVTTPDGRRWSALEMKTFPGLPDFDEGISEDIFSEECMSVENPNYDPSFLGVDLSKAVFGHNGIGERQETKGTTVILQENCDGGNRPNNNGAVNICKQQANSSSRHFSMLVLGGREQGLNGCGRKPITVWKIDFWK